MLRIPRIVSAAERGSIGKGDGLIPVPRISKRQRGNNQEQHRGARATATATQQLRGAEGFSRYAGPERATLSSRRHSRVTLVQLGQRRDYVTQSGVTQPSPGQSKG